MRFQLSAYFLPKQEACVDSNDDPSFPFLKNGGGLFHTPFPPFCTVVVANLHFLWIIIMFFGGALSHILYYYCIARPSVRPPPSPPPLSPNCRLTQKHPILLLLPFHLSQPPPLPAWFDPILTPACLPIPEPTWHQKHQENWRHILKDVIIESVQST